MFIIDLFEKECEEGNIEYKLKLFPKPDSLRIEKLTSQMLYRLNEGEGEAIYELGISDDGEIIGILAEEFDISMEILISIADSCDADLTVIRKSESSKNKWVAELLVRKRPYIRKKLPQMITIATIGNVDSGKSTLIGTLLSNELDDGEGKNAVLIARHRHEIESGRTSSVSTKILGFDSIGNIINHKIPKRSNIELAKESSKLIRFIDLAGHEKYLKTTIFGLTGYEPDFACVLIDGNRGIQKMSREHIGLAVLALKIPVFVVLTKKDLAPAHIYKKNLEELKKLLKSPGINSIPALVRDNDDASILAKKMSSGKIVPIFKVSSVLGDGLDLLKSFLNLLKKPKSVNSIQNQENKLIDDPFLLFIDEVFDVSGVGKVVSGIIQSGVIKSGDQILLGPSNSGNYEQVRIKSIQTQRIVVDEAYPGDYIAVALSFKIKLTRIIKGMVLTTYQPLNAVFRFEAEVLILHHPSTLRANYNTQIHLKTIRSQAKIVRIISDKEYLRSGDRAKVLFEFMYSPQFLMTGMKFVFREGRTKGIGTVTKIN